MGMLPINYLSFYAIVDSNSSLAVVSAPQAYRGFYSPHHPHILSPTILDLSKPPQKPETLQASVTTSLPFTWNPKPQTRNPKQSRVSSDTPQTLADGFTGRTQRVGATSRQACAAQRQATQVEARTTSQLPRFAPYSVREPCSRLNT